MLAASQDCIGDFKRLCLDAWTRGWHEANGGNLSYRLTSDDRSMFAHLLASTGAWHPLDQAIPSLAGELFLMTASGAYLNKVIIDTPHTMGIVELDDAGAAWRMAWGFEDGAQPSSELETHLAAYGVALEAGDGADRVVYHAHCPQVIAASTVLACNARTWTRALWKCMTECIIVFPQGIGFIPWMVPGSPELARATCELMRDHVICVWMQHGIMARAASFDKAFGLVDTVEKACGIYLAACAASGGEKPRHLVSDEQLRAICARYGITPEEEYLN